MSRLPLSGRTRASSACRLSMSAALTFRGSRTHRSAWPPLVFLFSFFFAESILVLGLGFVRVFCVFLVFLVVYLLFVVVVVVVSEGFLFLLALFYDLSKQH